MRPAVLTAIFRDGAEKGIQKRAALKFTEIIEDQFKDHGTIVIEFDTHSERKQREGAMARKDAKQGTEDRHEH